MKAGINRMIIAALTAVLFICTCGSRADALGEQPERKTEEDFTYADLNGLNFYFSSGAGGWATVLTIHEDGTFTGNYHDSEMGDIGDQYPKGTMYYCDFTGCFEELTQVDGYTYRTELRDIKFADTPDTEELKDGIRYVYSTAYGLDDAKDLYFYLPGKPVSDLPEPFTIWVPMASETAENGKITMYGLYNENTEDGFGGYPADEDTEDSDSVEASSDGLSAEQIKAHVDKVQKKSDELESRLAHEDMNQMEMNQVFADLYSLWDDEINEIWQYLQTKMPDTEMQTLTEEELKWINYKEARIREEGEKYEGGSIRPLAENRLGAQLTRERVYELMELIQGTVLCVK